jgi:putative ABC transport system ATP-binding protein
LRAVTIAGRADPEPQPAMIELEGVSKTFRSGGRATMAAVENITLSIAERSLTLVTGPSGSGKTTLLAVIGCMMRPSAGRVTVAGEDVTRLSEDLLAEVRRRSFGFVFQSNYLIRRATALENVMVPETLSGGEQQRVTIARALINDPEVVIADEPTAHLDCSSAHSFIDLAFEMVGRGKSVIVASHDPAICGVGSYNQVFELRDGHLA